MVTNSALDGRVMQLLSDGNRKNGPREMTFWKFDPSTEFYTWLSRSRSRWKSIFLKAEILGERIC